MDKEQIKSLMLEYFEVEKQYQDAAYAELNESKNIVQPPNAFLSLEDYMEWQEQHDKIVSRMRGAAFLRDYRHSLLQSIERQLVAMLPHYIWIKIGDKAMGVTGANRLVVAEWSDSLPSLIDP